MLTYNMDVEERSVWLRTTPGASVLAQPYYCTEAGLFLGREHFATARTDKESYILFYTLSGAGLVEQGNSRLELEKGQALLLNCRKPQSYCTAPGQSCWHHYWVHIDGPGVRAMEPILNPGATANSPHLTPARLTGSAATELFERILAGVNDPTTESVLRVGLAIHQLLVEMAQAQLAAQELSTGSGRELVQRSVEVIRRHYDEDLSLDELLRDMPISKSYFLRLFRRYMGTTPYNFLLCHRITMAKELLVMTELPIGEIARKVGFGDEANFSVRFSAMAGQSPLQYRKSIQNGK